MSTLDDVERELGRVVDRLNSLPLGRVEPLAPRCHEVAQALVAATRDLGGEVPPQAVLPEVGVQAVGAQLAVVGADFLGSARLAPDAARGPLGAMLDELTDLRRALP